MTFKTKIIYKNILTLILILTISAPSTMLFNVKIAQAQGVQVSTLLNFHSIQDYLKTFTLDKLAVMIANQLLQKMTASIVNWINTGFEGSPAFLTNPEGFFLDVGDQITGEFLAGSGELSKLCSPFSFDIRLNLALNQSVYATKRYECTLGKIVGNTRNAIATAGQNSGINIYGDPNGATLGNFINGDFNQGGYAGFIAYSMEPQNNPIGAELMARSELQSRIGQKKASVNADLNRGQGFLSWQKCTDVTADYDSAIMYGGSDGSGLRALGVSPDNLKPSGIKKTIDPKTKKDKYESCQTQTPGSIIGGSLQRQLNVPADKLVLVKTISDSIDAMLGALVNQMFTQGLAALSGSGSRVGGGNGSYLVQLSEEADNYNNSGALSIRNTSDSSSNSIVNIALNNAKTYEQGIDLLITSRQRLQVAKQCFAAKVSTRPLLSQFQKDYAQSQQNAIDVIITTIIDPLIATTTVKKLTAQSQADLFVSLLNSATGGGTNTNFNNNDINARQARVDAVVRAGAVATQNGVSDSTIAQQDLRSIQKLVEDFNKNADTYQSACNRFPDQISGFFGQ